MVTFIPGWKEEKNEETKPILKVHISECEVLTLEGISTAKIVWFRTKLRIRENHIVVLPVNILMGVAYQLLGPHNTLPCVLIIYLII